MSEVNESFRRPRDVAVVDGVSRGDGLPPTLYLARLPNGPLLVLDGPAAAIWRAAVSSEGQSQVVKRAADQMGVEPEEIREDVGAFVAELLVQGLLERVLSQYGPGEAPR